jgi:uncharacterized protein involved in tolerance to divalent cations
MKYRYRWTHNFLKEINGCAIIKTCDKKTAEITYDVKDLRSPYTIGQFATLKEARECARKVKR